MDQKDYTIKKLAERVAELETKLAQTEFLVIALQEQIEKGETEDEENGK